MDGKPGNEPKGSEILNSIVKDRVPRRHRKVMKKAKKELSERQKAYFQRRKDEMAKDPSKKAFGKYAPDYKPKEPEVEPPEPDDDIPDDEILNAKEIKLRDDLRWVLAKLGGRNKILKRAKKSESLQDVIIKELLKVEIKEMEARIRLKTPANQAGGFFMVISGLDDAKIKMKNVGADIKFLGNLFEDNENTIDIIKEGEDEKNQ